MVTQIRRLFLVLLLPLSALAQSQHEVIPLWEKGAPGFENRRSEPEQSQDWWVRNIHNPSLTVFLPPKEKANGCAMIVAPGGGFRELVFNSEGKQAAEFLNSIGVTVFVLKYRLPSETGSPYSMANVREDAYRAVRTVRSRASEFNIDPNRIGMLGFSAGGEVTYLAAMHYDDALTNATDAVDRLSARPDFQALIYPGTSDLFTVEKGMPPLFIACGYNDRPDISLGMAGLYLKYKEAGVKAELHIYSNVGHGFGYRTGTTTGFGDWPIRFREWLVDSGFMK